MAALASLAMLLACLFLIGCLAQLMFLSLGLSLALK